MVVRAADDELLTIGVSFRKVMQDIDQHLSPTSELRVPVRLEGQVVPGEDV